MHPPTSNQSELAIKQALSEARIGTYEAATTGQPPLTSALTLYAWNAQISAAMLVPLHLCEVVIRNAAADTIASAHGPEWPWDPGFVRSLPAPATGYNPRTDLITASRGKSTPGKVIPELKFVFWQRLFTSRFDARLWEHHLRAVLPQAEAAKPIREICSTIYGDLEQLRKLRNRIAHHEPIFQRPLAEDFKKIQGLIALRCTHTAAWMTKNQTVLSLLEAKPS